MKLLLQGEKSLFPTTKAIFLLIYKNMFFIIIKSQSITINNLNIDIIFKVIWVGFIWLREVYIIHGKSIVAQPVSMTKNL